MAKKQIYKQGGYVYEEEKISKLSIIDNENEENGFVLITEEEEEIVNTSPAPVSSFYKGPNSLIKTHDKDIEYCTNRNCSGTIDAYGFCSKCTRYEHTEGFYGGY